MAIKFSGLPASGALDGTEVVAVSQVVSGTLTSVKTTTGAIAALGDGGGGMTAMNEQTGTSYTLAVGDATKAVRCTNGAAVALTIAPSASVAIPVLSTIPIFQGGAGVITLTAGSGVTFESPNGVTTAGIGDFRTAFQRAADVWVIG